MFEDDLKKAETISLPITLVILLLAFGALVAAGLPLLLGVTAVMATMGLVAGCLSQLSPATENLSSVVVLDRPRRRRRLLAVLHPPRARGARAPVATPRRRSPPPRPRRAAPC